MIFNCVEEDSWELKRRHLDRKETKPVNPKWNQSWTFTGRTDAEALILWPPDVKSQIIRKDPNAGRNWKQEEKGLTEDEMIGWHHWLKGHEFEQALGDGEGQGSLECCSPCRCNELDMTEWLKNNRIVRLNRRELLEGELKNSNLLSQHLTFSFLV